MIKVYIKGILIAIKSERLKKTEPYKDELLLQVATLVAENKRNVQISLTERIQQILQQIKLIGALDIAQSITDAKQCLYEFRDKPGKQLARRLSEHPMSCKISSMIKGNGELITTPEKELDIFLK